MTVKKNDLSPHSETPAIMVVFFPMAMNEKKESKDCAAKGFTPIINALTPYHYVWPNLDNRTGCPVYTLLK